MRRSQLRGYLLAALALLGCTSPRANRARDLTSRVVEVRSTGESAPAAVVAVAFRNQSADALEIRSYRLRWPGGTFTAEMRDLLVPPHAEVERKARVDSGAGDISTLRREDVTIEVVVALAR